MKLKYNYIICGNDGYYLIGYKDVIDLPNVLYYCSYWDKLNFIPRILSRITFSNIVNKYLKQPFSNISYKEILKGDFDNNAPICIIMFSSNHFLFETPYLDYFDKKYPENKKILYYQDKVQVHTPGINMDHLKSIYDIIYSYDRADCNKYGLKYYPTPYSSYIIPPCSSLPETDIFFCGRAKKRYDIIIEIFKELSRQGYKCDFFLSSMPDNCPRIEGIKYNQYLSYIQYLQHLSHSKVVLEVMQQDADGFTPRLWESIMYDKHLLTNNKYLKESTYYNSSYMHEIEGGIEAFSQFVNSPVLYDKKEKDFLSPTNFLYDIESNLC